VRLRPRTPRARPGPVVRSQLCLGRRHRRRPGGGGLRRGARPGAARARARRLLLGAAAAARQDAGLPLHVLAADELAAFPRGDPNKKDRETIAELLRNLVAEGRAAGIIVSAFTQKPDSATIPTTLRDNIGDRLAFACATPEASDTILGNGWAANGHNAARIGKQPGSYLYAEDVDENLRIERPEDREFLSAADLDRWERAFLLRQADVRAGLDDLVTEWPATEVRPADTPQ
jgi:hypothetical protein